MSEVVWIRARHTIKSLVRIAGILLVLLGAYNMLLAPALLMEPIAPYRQGLPILVSEQGGGYFLGDVAIIAIGAVIAWFV
jgi:hypothetical protein